jgi:SAM-dependent methyltransferase
MFQIHREMESRHWWFLGRARIVTALVDHLMQGAVRQLVVDLGCGTGGMVAVVGEKYGCVGVDPSAEAIEYAKALYPGRHFERGTLTEVLPALRDRVGLCLLNDVLEHIEDDRGMLGEVVRIVEPGTHILITVPADRRLWSDHDVTAQHFRRYAIDDLAALWQELPIHCRLLSYFNSNLYWPIRLARGMGRTFKIRLGKNGSDFSLPPAPINQFLACVFASERHRLKALLAGGVGPSRSVGVSIVAVLTKVDCQ